MTITSKSCSVYPQAISKLQLRKLFLDCDANNDGILTKEEIKKAFHNLVALLPGYIASEGLKHADANKDGCVGPEELDGLIDYAYKLQYAAIANH